MPVLQWSLLFVLSLLLSLLFLLIHLPGPLLLGSMIVGIIFSLRGISLHPPRCTFLGAQAILGCMIAQNLTGSIFTTLAAHWPLVIVILLATLISSAIIGWQIGLGFDKQIFLMALRPLPQILLSIFSLMAICAAMAWGLAHYMQIDFLTAYLATSPGGVDSVAVIAAGSHADMALIMAMQTLRLFSILLTGPAVARFISVHAPKRPA